MTPIQLSAVLFQEAGWWIAQCIEYDIATQSRSLEQLLPEFQRVVVAQVCGGLEAGQEDPLAELPTPPAFYRGMYEGTNIEVMPQQAEFELPPNVADRVAPPRFKLVA